MPNIPGPVGAPGPVGGPPPNPNPSPADVSAVLSVEQAWYKLMHRWGVWLPFQIQKGHDHLDAVDKRIGIKSR